jgi:hypothetical protein
MADDRDEFPLRDLEIDTAQDLALDIATLEGFVDAVELQKGCLDGHGRVSFVRGRSVRGGSVRCSAARDARGEIGDEPVEREADDADIDQRHDDVGNARRVPAFFE